MILSSLSVSKVDQTQTTPDGLNILMMFLPNIRDEEDLQIVELICRTGINLNHQDREGQSVLSRAVEMN